MCAGSSATARSVGCTSVLTRRCSASGRQAWRTFATCSSTAGGPVPDLGGRVALVTGTAGGIGAGIVEALREHGATVHSVDLDEADVADPHEVAALVERIGRIDILVNNAGGVVGQVGKPLEDVSDDDWRAIVDANL